MICKANRRIAGFGLLAALAIAAPLAAAQQQSDSGESVQEALAEASAALARQDGVAAEMAGRRALDQGAARERVAAYIGEGELLQGDFRDAREWLADAEFDGASRQRGLYALARLEMAEQDLPAAAQAFDQLLQLGPGSALAWVDIGRMRYSAGEHHAALEAARRAVSLDPQESRALEFLALLIRDGQGYNEAIPLFRDALQNAPNDLGLLGQYAATLGDTGQHTQMLRIARRMVELDGSDPRAYYLQAVLAARSGSDDLARRLMWRTGGDYDAIPAGLLLAGVLEYRAGNFALAAEEFNQLLRIQPFNETALLLMGRALLANGEANEVVAILEAQAQRPDASNYLLVLMGRAYEQIGERDRAATYLDRSAMLGEPSGRPITAFLVRDGGGRVRDRGNPVVQLRLMLTDGDFAGARALANDLNQRFSGSVDLEFLAGDVELLAGAPAAALAQYRKVAQVRNNWALVRRVAAAHAAMGDGVEARRAVALYLSQNPRDGAAATLLGRMHGNAGNPARGAVLLRYAAATGSGKSDPILLAQLAEHEIRLGNGAEAAAFARTAHDLQRGNRRVARALAQVYRLSGAGSAQEQALLAKSRGVGIR